MSSVVIRFSGVEKLPDAAISASAGPASRQFCDRGLPTVQAAARWLQNLPYAPGAGMGPLRALDSGSGDCTSKHAALIALTDEVGVEVNLVWGIYRLDGSLVPAAGPVLAEWGLPFVPNVHCFVQSADRFVDLTEGNCTGKSRQVEHYLALFPARPGADDRAVLRLMTELITADDPRFAGCSPGELLAARDLCAQAKTAACLVDPAPALPDRSARWR